MRDRRAYNREWYEAHRESENAGSRAYYAANTDKCKQLVKDWREAHPEKVKEFKHRETMKNIVKMRVRIARWKIEEKQRFVNALTCEHLVRDQGRVDRKQGWTGPRIYRRIRMEGYPRDKYTVLCMNCNFARKNGAPCPHESKKEGLRAVAG